MIADFTKIPPWRWWVLSLIVPFYYGLLSLTYSFSQDYVIQDDGRLHIVWLQTYTDSQLFPDDAIANYYTTIAPVGFKAFYWLLAQLGIEPLILGKILPLFLALVTTIYLFRFTLLIFPVPAAGFWVTLFLNQNFWLKDDLVSAAPRAFVYPLFAAFLYYLIKRSLVGCCVVFLLEGLFYPQILLVSLGIAILRLFIFKTRKIQFTVSKKDYFISLFGLIVTIGVGLFFSNTVSQQWGDLTTVQQMQIMPEFNLNGRREYFGVDLISFYFRGASGLRAPLYPPIIWLSTLLPFVINLSNIKKLNFNILGQILVSSIGLFILAHLLFHKLYLPSRYTYYSLRFLMVIASGIVLVVLLNKLNAWLVNFKQQQPIINSLISQAVSFFLCLAILIPAIPSLVLDCQNWIVGKSPEIYQFLATQPKDVLVASISQEADNIPAFTQRSILVSPEYALPYHLDYYSLLRTRAIAIVQAQYSFALKDIQQTIKEYNIDFWLLDKNAFNLDYLPQQQWLINSSFASEVQAIIKQQKQDSSYALAKLLPECTVAESVNNLLLNADCILN
ncbi:MAG TPA: hypothetical protein ACFCUY_14860 [Xenococcaceae cyanobacterium]